MADDVKLEMIYGRAMIRPQMTCRVYEVPPTLFEIIKGYARSAMIYLCVALLIFCGSYAATKDPEAFARGFAGGFIGYMIVRGASR